MNFFKSKPTVFKFNNGDLVEHKSNPIIVWVVVHIYKNGYGEPCYRLNRVRNSGKKDSIDVCEFELEAAN